MKIKGIFLATWIAFTITPASADTIRVGIYAGLEKDICPQGYTSDQRCDHLSGARFDELKQNRRLRIIRNWEELSLDFSSHKEGLARITLGGELGILRRYRDLGRIEPDSAQVAVVVVEWLDDQKQEENLAPNNNLNKDSKFSLQSFSGNLFAPSKSNRPKKLTPPPSRRSFDHAGLGNLDPELRYEWKFQHGNKQLKIIFE
jgi:hypothetical protein